MQDEQYIDYSVTDLLHPSVASCAELIPYFFSFHFTSTLSLFQSFPFLTSRRRLRLFHPYLTSLCTLPRIPFLLRFLFHFSHSPDPALLFPRPLHPSVGGVTRQGADQVCLQTDQSSLDGVLSLFSFCRSRNDSFPTHPSNAPPRLPSECTHWLLCSS